MTDYRRRVVIAAPRASSSRGEHQPRAEDVRRSLMSLPLSTSILLACSFGALLITAGVLSPLHQLPIFWRTTVLLVVVGGCAGCGRLRDVPTLTVLGWLFLNGFVVHTKGMLSWHTDDDILRLAMLFVVAASGVGIGALARGRSRSASRPPGSGPPLDHAH